MFSSSSVDEKKWFSFLHHAEGDELIERGSICIAFGVGLSCFDRMNSLYRVQREREKNKKRCFSFYDIRHVMFLFFSFSFSWTCGGLGFGLL